MERIKEILPDDVRCRAERRERIEVRLCHPHPERGVLLSESLSGRDGRDAFHRLGRRSRVDEHILIVFSFARRRQVIADEFAESELNQASEK